jgi:peptide/nickel transport system permease protein
MLTYLIHRLLLMTPTFFGITLIAFLIIHLAPGDPAELRASGGLAAGTEGGRAMERRGAVDRALQEWRMQFGLDKPLYMQYLVWLKNLFTLDFGVSFKDNQPVWAKIVERLPATITVEVLSTLLIYLVAIPLGIYSATHQYSFGDQLTTFGAFVLFALPSFSVVTSMIGFRQAGCVRSTIRQIGPGGTNVSIRRGTSVSRCSCCPTPVLQVYRASCAVACWKICAKTLCKWHGRKGWRNGS